MSPDPLPLSADRLFERVATAPISWGVCEVPGWGHQLEVERVLGEMRSLGFTATELGSIGWLPERSDELRALLSSHGLTLLAAFVPLVMHDPSAADEALAEAERMAALLQDAGAVYFNTAPVTSLDWSPRRPYETFEWDHLAGMFGRVEEICRAHGLHQVVHEHASCVIETAAEVDWLLANTDVDLVLDTGHLAVGGYDPLAFAHNHADRTGLVHLKDADLAVVARLNQGEVSLMEAVQSDLFPALGRGDLPLGDIVAALEGAGFDGWYVIEQDCAITGAVPEPGNGPVRDVASSVAYLRAMAPASADDVASTGSYQTTRGGNPT